MESVTTGGPRGPEAEFVALYRTSLPQVLGFLYVRTGGDEDLANDLAAETFASAVERFNTGAQAQVTTSWLCTVARRRLIDHWRRQTTASTKRHLVHQRTFEQDTPETSFVERQQVADALGMLNADYRLALVLHHLDGHSVREVAEVLGRTEKAAESLIGRAKEAFRDHYQSNEFEGSDNGEI